MIIVKEDEIISSYVQKNQPWLYMQNMRQASCTQINEGNYLYNSMSNEIIT